MCYGIKKANIKNHITQIIHKKKKGEGFRVWQVYGLIKLKETKFRETKINWNQKLQLPTNIDKVRTKNI
jgi:hypothetical protein